jgi:hypothetical protein
MLDELRSQAELVELRSLVEGLTRKQAQPRLL